MTDCILLVHDDPSLLRAVGARFEETGSEIVRELSVETAAATLTRSRPDTILLATSLAAPEAIGRLGGHGIPVVLFGEQPDRGTVKRGLEAGAQLVVDVGADFATVVSVAKTSARAAKAQRVIETQLAMTAPRHGLDSLGTSNAMKQVAQQIGLHAQSDRTTILVQGEAGVGKAWAARLIHDLGSRAKKPFFEVRCTGMNAAYLESLLFGHEQGVFVEATERRRGLMETADGGTVLLREIGDLPAEVQPKLLRALESRTFRRLGGSDDIVVDTRLMVTARRPLSEDVAAERLREDLFYRLSVMPLHVPPVRDRSQEDKLGLITSIHQDLRLELPEGPAQLAVDVHERFLGYSWPGNVREMGNVLERSMLVARGQVTINVEHLPGEFRARSGVGDRRHTPMTLEALEQQHIDRTLRYHGGNRTRAAKELGISRATLINKIKLYNISD
ncbi:MAG: sigma-54-dependent Fis family transcriptional regulator [Gemmatimonadetes bacterium]|nr:sigma-54-dependent Fis family transcriptional regulator [Gemmatimonadota bacterium]